MFSAEKVAKPLDFWGEMCYNGVAEQSKAKQSKAKQSKAKQSKAKQSKAKQSRAIAIAITILKKKYYNVEDTLKLLMPLGL